LSLAVSSEQDFLFCGYEDGSIRKFSIKDNSCTLHIQTQEKTKTIEE
jgi:hypothetical protein